MNNCDVCGEPTRCRPTLVPGYYLCDDCGFRYDGWHRRKFGKQPDLERVPTEERYGEVRFVDLLVFDLWLAHLLSQGNRWLDQRKEEVQSARLTQRASARQELNRLATHREQLHRQLLELDHQVTEIESVL